MHTDENGETDLDLVVAEREDVADGVVALVLRDPQGRALPSWEPGAHVDLVLAEDLVRQYSLCGDPADASSYRVAVLREPAGRGGSAHVHDHLARGTAVRVGGPRNHFPLVAARRYLFIAGGVGITPLLPMVEAAEAAGADWCLVHRGRTRASMAFGQELRTRFPHRVTTSASDESGPLDLDALLARADEGTSTYCCGPESLLAAVEARCAASPHHDLHVERFAPKPVAAPVMDGTFQVELALTGKVVDVPLDKSVLEAVEEAGVEVLSSCGEGTCGTCEVTVLAGRADHRDSILSEEEQLTGTTMMICVSRALTDRLVLQL